MSTTSRATELEVINQMLACIGEAPIQSLVDEANEDSLIAQQTLDEVCRELSEQDWWFNRETKVPYSPNASGNIEIPENVVSLEDTDIAPGLRDHYVERSGVLYDLVAKTDVFTTTVYLDVTYLLGWSDLPVVAQSYVAARASRKFADRMEKHGPTHQNLREDEAEALVRLRKADARVVNPRMLGGHRANEYGRGRRGYSNVY